MGGNLSGMSEKQEEKAMSDYEFCRVEREGPLTIITLNRPEVMNALHPPAHFELNAVFDAFAADPEQWVAIVTGAGERAFSAGNDLKYQASGGKMSAPPGGFAGLTSRFDLNKPLIAAVNGIAMGGGFEIALACDLIVASETAVFALPEPRVGLAALAGGLASPAARDRRQAGAGHDPDRPPRQRARRISSSASSTRSWRRAIS